MSVKVFLMFLKYPIDRIFLSSDAEHQLRQSLNNHLMAFKSLPSNNDASF